MVERALQIANIQSTILGNHLIKFQICRVLHLALARCLPGRKSCPQQSEHHEEEGEEQGELPAEGVGRGAEAHRPDHHSRHEGAHRRGAEPLPVADQLELGDERGLPALLLLGERQRSAVAHLIARTFPDRGLVAATARGAVKEAEFPGDERVGEHLTGEVEVDEGEVDGVLPLLPPQAANVVEYLVDVHLRHVKSTWYQLHVLSFGSVIHESFFLDQIMHCTYQSCFTSFRVPLSESYS